MERRSRIIDNRDDRSIEEIELEPSRTTAPKISRAIKGRDDEQMRCTIAEVQRALAMTDES